MVKAGEDKTATLHDTATNAEGSGATTTDHLIGLTVNPVAETPGLSTPATLTLGEGGTTALTISLSGLDSDDATQTTVTVTGVPTDATLTSAANQAGITSNGGGSWTVT